MALAAGGAVVSVLAFPPYGPGWLVLIGVALLMTALRGAGTRTLGLAVGAIYGLVFFGWLMWWLVELEVIALALVPLQAAFLAAYGWWLTGHNHRSPGAWLTLAVGGWGFMELIRYYVPFGGLEWGAVGYALSDHIWTRFPAAVVGTSGLTLTVVLIGALVAQLVSRKTGRATLIGGMAVVVVLAGSLGWWASAAAFAFVQPATIVQGSTPCPFEDCPPDERLSTFQQHLALTQSLDSDAGLVVWAEGSTGSINADPVNNPEIGKAISEQAQRLGSRFVVGGDRVVSDTEWINANVYFDVDGNIVGEYRKQHPVPFGEYIPLRPLFDWIPALDQVPRDMIRGDGPVLFGEIGSIISFEGGFSRYALGVRREGANVIIVNTNEASYGPDAPTAEQFIGMTRMRAVELGVPVIHAAVTGKSVFVESDGTLGESTGLGTAEILKGEYGAELATPYTVIGDIGMYLAALAAVVMWLVPSHHRSTEEE